MRSLFITILIAALTLSACGGALLGTETNTTANDTAIDVMPEAPVPPPATVPEEPDLNDLSEPTAGRYTITKTEGDLIVLKPKAIDPDGDEITYTFTGPFAGSGEWQTTFGDAGTYDVTITATDTEGATTSANIRVIVLPANRPPTLSCPERIVVREGEEVVISCDVSDEEGDEYTLSYTGWMQRATRTTSYEDAGTYTVNVAAADAAGMSEATVVIEVENVNRPPAFPADFPSSLTAQEGDTLRIDTSGISDPDGDDVHVTVSEPFDEQGVWHTQEGDAGTYAVDVIATDGEAIAKRRVAVEVKMVNTAPVLEPIDDITVSEGETIRLPLVASDREGDPLVFEVDGWMQEAEYTTTYDDAGEHTVRVTVTDGQLIDSQVVHITVLNKNRPPVFKVPA